MLADFRAMVLKIVDKVIKDGVNKKLFDETGKTVVPDR